MCYTNRFTEGNRVDGDLHPASRAANTYNTSYFSMRDYHRAVCIVDVGSIPEGATLDVKLQQAKDTDGTSVKDITGKAITQLTDADDNKIVAIELKTEELDVDNRFDCIRAQAVVGVDAIPCSVMIIRTEPRFAAVGVSQLDEVVD